MTIFDINKNIFTKSIEISKEEIEKEYDCMMENRLLSFDNLSIHLVNELNKYYPSKYQSYLYYSNSVQKRNRVPFANIKRKKDDELIEFAKKYLQMNNRKIEEIFSLIENELKEKYHE
jgi:hypothetical protein